MKIKLLIVTFSLFITASSLGQVTANQVDDFEDGTTQGWTEGGASPNPPVNIPTDGPAGANDNYLQNDSAGGGGPGSRMAMFNQSQWQGDYTSEGIVAIRFDARVSVNDLDFRVAMDGTGGRIVSTTVVTVTAGSGWQQVEIPILASDMQTVSGGFDIAQTLADCFQFRIISAPNPAYQGESINARMEIDNIEAATTLSTEEFTIEKDFSMSPNPGSGLINLRVPAQITTFNVEVFDILGKRIYSESITNSNGTMDVSNWNNGVYLVKISNERFSQTKRFVKH